MPKPETNRQKIVSRLEAEGWVNQGGGKHDVFHKEGVGAIAVPRHRTISVGVARQIKKTAGWK